MNINLHIERLILDDVNVAPDQRHLLQTSVAAELTRMLAEGTLSPDLAQGTNLPRLSGRSIQINEVGKPAQLGRQIAQSVYGGIGHE